MSSAFVIDRDEENRQREITQAYLNFLDDSVCLSISLLILRLLLTLGG